MCVLRIAPLYFLGNKQCVRTRSFFPSCHTLFWTSRTVVDSRAIRAMPLWCTFCASPEDATPLWCTTVAQSTVAENRRSILMDGNVRHRPEPKIRCRKRSNPTPQRAYPSLRSEGGKTPPFRTPENVDRPSLFPALFLFVSPPPITSMSLSSPSASCRS